jgi:hypothetical protein
VSLVEANLPLPTIEPDKFVAKRVEKLFKQKLELVKARKELGEKATDAANMSVALLHFSEIRKHVAD